MGLNEDEVVLHQWKCGCGYTEYVTPETWLNMFCRNPNCTCRIGRKMSRTGVYLRRNCITVWDEEEVLEIMDV